MDENEKRKREYDTKYRNVQSKFDAGDTTLDEMWQQLCELDDDYL